MITVELNSARLQELLRRIECCNPKPRKRFWNWPSHTWNMPPACNGLRGP